MNIDDWISTYKIHPTHTINYLSYQGSRTYRGETFNRDKLKPQGIMSKKAVKRLKHCMQWLLIISNLKTVYSKKEKKKFKFKINFITLTLSSKQNHSDGYIKKHMLEPFLKWMERKYYCHSYIWKAEAQKKGNIHFHITTNKFIHWKDVRIKWNSIQFKHGYISTGKNMHAISKTNSTDIHSVKNEKSIINYMLKYFTKNEPDKRKITGRIWAASTNLNQSAFIIDETSNYFYSIQDMVRDNNHFEGKQCEQCYVYIHRKKIFKLLPLELQQQFKTTIRDLKQKDHRQTYIEVESLFENLN